ncbi:hypothetical protein RD792_000162 [Penstemon davidsonii]|uniref:Glycosyltransferase n=1 Tax=Penstemon davidsonii TaxID=160366 RepID=A0ABR0DUD5_9LAMI|nr:hypothetical protein RD792_000162 [Penstemon davidsonii]
MKKTELIFIPAPGLSHVVSTVETAKLLLQRDERLSVTVLIIRRPNDDLTDNYIQKYSPNSNTNSRLQFINLPYQENSPVSTNVLFDFINNQNDHIREIVSNLMKSPSQSSDYKLGGLVLDMFCTKFIEIANEFNLPSYVFFTSGACTLGLFFHLLELKYEQNQDLTMYKNSDVELSIPCFSIPVPVKVLPAVFVEEGPMSNIFLNYFKRIPETKGIMVNTFHELESFAIEALSNQNKYPKVYPIGPILSSSSDDEQTSHQGYDEIKKWLDEQPESSVVFLCFGSMGSFEESQVKEIASALEKSGQRFLWSLRKPGGKGMMHLPTEYEDFREVLPEEFLERTEGIGKVIGWTPQVAVLSHPAIGGFVSHCGWNSTLESVWFGVPVATFPLYAEQQLNAFELVKELGMAEEIRIDYRKDMRGEKPSEIVGSGEIEAAIRRLMAEEGGSRVRNKVKEMKERSRTALMDGGSSYNAQSVFIEDVIKNVS